jgi:hypothetical protein
MVYKIIKYNLIGGVVFRTFQEMPELEEVTINKGWDTKKYVYKGTNKEYQTSHLWSFTTTKHPTYLDSQEKFLPFFADVREDLPSSCRMMKPKTWTNCQLMTEKHGGYLQFYHPETKQVLRIALNSNYYTPIEQ